MKINYANFFWQLLVVISAICVIVLGTLTVQSLLRLFSPQGNVNDADTTPVVTKSAPPAHNVQPVADAGEPPYVNPASSATPMDTGRPVPPATVKQQNFDTDFQKIREREKARRETIENLRKQARENPAADNIPSEKQLKQIEESGADFL